MSARAPSPGGAVARDAGSVSVRRCSTPGVPRCPRRRSTAVGAAAPDPSVVFSVRIRISSASRVPAHITARRQRLTSMRRRSPPDQKRRPRDRPRRRHLCPRHRPRLLQLQRPSLSRC
ncbi:uncharacterized protein LOC126355370 [Schistocerca gregaria]|uniref:uncharacterized protein LOC126355370 n=1 Tax=Schistocerca gregaria TaxID=7010 RepID=UPI00211E1CA2|nr:uncharacterized protein LOC126355370 [Schistocerca gregaria]